MTTSVDAQKSTFYNAGGICTYTSPLADRPSDINLHPRTPIMTNNLDARNSSFYNAGRDMHVYITPMLSGANSSSGPHPLNDAPIDLLSLHFTGRQRELALIAGAFNHPRCGVPLRCVLFGKQGVGKSQLTYEWAKSTFTRKENTYIFWMSATTIEKLDQGFSKILHLVNHDDRSHSDQTVRLTAARRWLEDVDTGNWLLVLDNVFPETLDFLRRHLPRRNGRGSILFTTRTRDVAVVLASAAGEQHEVIEVPILDVKDGVELFLGHFGEGEIIDTPSAKLEAIVKLVGCLPLAISHTAAYMIQSGNLVEDMLAVYMSGENINKLYSWENSFSSYEHKSVAALFHCQLQDLERTCPHASNLLRVMAYLDPESIPLNALVSNARAVSKLYPQISSQPRSVLRRIQDEVLCRTASLGDGIDDPDGVPTTTVMSPHSLLALMQSPVELQNAVTQLQNRYLIDYQHSSQPSTLRIHDLIQSVVLEETKKCGTDKQWFELAVDLVYKAFQKIGKYGSPEFWTQCETLVSHIQSLTARQEISSKAKAQLLKLNRHVAGYLQNRGRFGESERLYVTVLEDTKQLYGLEDPRTLSMMHNLACAHESQGRHGDAEALLKQVLQIRKKQFGPDHPQLHSNLYMLGYVYCSQSRFDEAEELFKNLLAAREKQLGMEHERTLYARHALATVHSSQKRYTEAETLFKQVLQSRKELLGPEHRDTLATIHSLALVYHSQDRHSEAEALYNGALPISEKLLGSDHPDTLLMKHDLALVYMSQHRYEDAKVLFEFVSARREKVLGLSHQDTKRTMEDLAAAYKKLGRDEEAEMVSCNVGELS